MTSVVVDVSWLAFPDSLPKEWLAFTGRNFGSFDVGKCDWSILSFAEIWLLEAASAELLVGTLGFTSRNVGLLRLGLGPVVEAIGADRLAGIVEVLMNVKYGCVLTKPMIVPREQ